MPEWTRRVYTFGHGQPDFPGYVVVYGHDWAHCRAQMNRAYARWAAEYEDELAAGVAEFSLPLRAVFGPPGAPDA